MRKPVCPIDAQQRGQELYREHNYEAAIEAFNEVRLLSCSGHALPLTDARQSNSGVGLRSAL